MANLVNQLDLDKLIIKGGTQFEIMPEADDSFEKLDLETESDKKQYFVYLSEFINIGDLNLNTDDEFHFNKEPFEVIEKKMEPVTENGYVKKKIIRNGYGEFPKDGENVKIDYNAYVEFDAIPFDSTYGRKKPYFLKINDETLPGFYFAIKSMRVNEKSWFLMNSKIAYKSSGLQRIPLSPMILLEVELHAILLHLRNELTNIREFKVIIKHCLALEEKAKLKFKLMDYKGALNIYYKAINKLEESQLEDYEDQKVYDEELIKLHTNLLICSTVLRLPKKGCIHANAIMRLCKEHKRQIPAKVLYNHARCTYELEDFQSAKIKLYKAKELKPNDKQIKELLLKVEKAINNKKEQEKTMSIELIK